MRLSAEELAQARTATREVGIIQQRKRFWVAYGLLLLNAFVQVLEHHHQPWIRWFQLGLLVVMIALGFYRWRGDRQAKAHYASNIELLRLLTEREPALADSIGDPFAYRPLLHAWNQRLEKRALLWRVDRFLSGKGWRAH